MALLLALILAFSLQTAFSQKFPLLVGGFSGATTIDDFLFDNNMNLLVTGRSTDSSLVSVANANFAMMMPGNVNSWLWTVQLPLVNEIISTLVYRADNLRWALYYKSNKLIILDAATGATTWYISESATSSRKFMCASKPCEMFFINSALYLFGTTSDSPPLLGMMGIYTESVVPTQILTMTLYPTVTAMQFRSVHLGHHSYFTGT